MTQNRSSEKMIDTLPNWERDLIGQICNAMKSYYCLSEKFSKHEDDFRQSLVDTFKHITETHEPNSKEEYQIYIDSLNKTLNKFDPHLKIEYNKEFIAERKNNGEMIENKALNVAQFNLRNPPKDILLMMNESCSKPEVNYGFIDISKEKTIIPSDIGYLKISFLLDPQTGANETEEKYRVGPNAVKVINDLMRKMVDKNGVIIDLRHEPQGGSPEMVQYIVSFFIKEKGIPINQIEDRLTGSLKSYTTIDTPVQLFDVPVDILIDDTTFSACEELAYDFQQLNIQFQRDGKQKGDRFQVIGTPSRGGAHPECSFPLVSSSGTINENIILRIPFARSINPTSGTNWEDDEKKGVQPDKIISNENALAFSVEHLKKKIILKEDKKAIKSSVSQSIFHHPKESPDNRIKHIENKPSVLRKKGG